MTDFFQTVMGRQFYDGTMPRIARGLEQLNENLEKMMAKSPAKKDEISGVPVNGPPDWYNERIDTAVQQMKDLGETAASTLAVHITEVFNGDYGEKVTEEDRFKLVLSELSSIEERAVTLRQYLNRGLWP
jgi:hypothetical protein